MKNQTYEEFYLKYRKISRAYAYGVLHDWNISDDVSQDVLYKMYTKRKHLNIDNEKMMYSLIRRASVNKAMDYKKKSSFRHEVICTADVTEVLNVYKTVDAERRNFCVKRRINLCIWYWKDFVRSSLLIMTF